MVGIKHLRGQLGTRHSLSLDGSPQFAIPSLTTTAASSLLQDGQPWSNLVTAKMALRSPLRFHWSLWGYQLCNTERIACDYCLDWHATSGFRAEIIPRNFKF